MVWTFGPFTIDAVRKTVTKHGAPLRLSLKCAELLLALVQKAGCEITKEELIEAAWSSSDVSDATLAQHVFLLRRELRDTGLKIATVRGIGYRFEGHARRGTGDDERERSRAVYLREAAAFRDLGTEAGLRSAIDLYGRAIALHPSDAQAYAGRAGCRRILAEYLFADPLVMLSGARGDAATALACDPDNVYARIESAFAAALCDRDADAAKAHLSNAMRIAPANPMVAYLRVWLPLMRGEVDEALRLAKEYGGTLAASALYFARRYSEAQEIFARTAEHDPAARMMHGACRLFGGDAAAAVSAFRSVCAHEPDAGGSRMPAPRLYALGLLVYALGSGGEWLEARKMLTQIEAAMQDRYVSPMLAAVGYIGLGEHSTALQLIEIAASRLDPWTAFLRIDPLMDALRGDARFHALAERLAA